MGVELLVFGLLVAAGVWGSASPDVAARSTRAGVRAGVNAGAAAGSARWRSQAAQRTAAKRRRHARLQQTKGGRFLLWAGGTAGGVLGTTWTLTGDALDAFGRACWVAGDAVWQGGKAAVAGGRAEWQGRRQPPPPTTKTAPGAGRTAPPTAPGVPTTTTGRPPLTVVPPVTAPPPSGAGPLPGPPAPPAPSTPAPAPADPDSTPDTTTPQEEAPMPIAQVVEWTNIQDAIDDADQIRTEVLEWADRLAALAKHSQQMPERATAAADQMNPGQAALDAIRHLAESTPDPAGLIAWAEAAHEVAEALKKVQHEVGDPATSTGAGGRVENFSAA